MNSRRSKSDRDFSSATQSRAAPPLHLSSSGRTSVFRLYPSSVCNVSARIFLHFACNYLSEKLIVTEKGATAPFRLFVIRIFALFKRLCGLGNATTSLVIPRLPIGPILRRDQSNQFRRQICCHLVAACRCQFLIYILSWNTWKGQGSGSNFSDKFYCRLIVAYYCLIQW